jgi:hypothetical protein
LIDRRGHIARDGWYDPLIPGWAKVEGDGGPHINRSVEAQAMLVLGGSFFSRCCRIASLNFCAGSAAQKHDRCRKQHRRPARVNF